MTNERQLNIEAQRIWEANAAWWADKIGETGNLTQRAVVAPSVEAMVGDVRGRTVLECACGSGVFARRLAEMGAQVVGFDFSRVFIERAQATDSPHNERIVYHVLDATDKPALLALGEGKFDSAVCLMALMDMAQIDPLFEALRQLLKPAGHFVFAVSHPCFNSAPGIVLAVEEEDRDGRLAFKHTVKVSHYRTPVAYKGIGIAGQPEPHYYFHRSLADVLGAGFRAGFVLDALAEPVWPFDPDPGRPLSRANFKEIPYVLVARMRLTS